MAVRRLGRVLECGIVQDREHPVDGGPEPLGWGMFPRVAAAAGVAAQEESVARLTKSREVLLRAWGPRASSEEGETQ
jgi:hypothetical protein